MGEEVVTAFLCGDVMLGRGVDQILPHPGAPTLWEPEIGDARAYVGLAEAANGPIPRPVGFPWPWGDALRVLDEARPHARVLNLETAITQAGAAAPGKSVHYRMHPANLPSLVAARPDACVLANNHVMDFGQRGLEDTVAHLAAAGLASTGAGRSAGEAAAPAVVSLPGGRRLLVFGYGATSSGIPSRWAATGDRPGVALTGVSIAGADRIIDRVQRVKRGTDLVIVSVHWGPNWGYDVGPEEISFAHRLIDGGIDVVHGHSSHHPRPIEVYRDRLVLYGCGDFIDDYEGIGGYERYRDDLRLMYLVSVRPGTGELAGVRIVPLQARKMRLWPAPARDTRWLRALLDGISAEFRVRVDLTAEGALALRWGSPG